MTVERTSAAAAKQSSSPQSASQFARRPALTEVELEALPLAQAEPQTKPLSQAGSRFHRDFSQIPVHHSSALPPVIQPPVIQLKAAIGAVEQPIAKTGLPDSRLPAALPNALKGRIEALSGIGMNDVSVHYNSYKPAAVKALAYTQGTEIHVAPGQERHLPHEAWHVVQQKQGRVQPTAQTNGVSLNHDRVLEQEADQMGRQALQIRHSGAADVSAPVAKAIAAPVLQRKIGFFGYEDLPAAWKLTSTEIKELHLSVKTALLLNYQLLRDTFGDRFDETYRELTQYTDFAFILKSLLRSPIEYGEINLDNPVHLVHFFRDAGRYLMKNYTDQEKEDKKLRQEQDDQRSLWQSRKDSLKKDLKGTLPAYILEERIYKTALLGTGASIADYAAVQGRALDPSATVILGKTQPWDPAKTNPLSRGIEFVNHPPHMTSPLRKDTQLPKDKRGRDETFEGNAQKLTDDIRQVLKRFPHQIDATITKVKKKDNWYSIETDKGTYYAETVISGLGIGSHLVPKNNLAAQITSEADKAQEKERVMDLDTFQRKLKDPRSNVRRAHRRGGCFIGVAGPNAGVDAIYEATELGMYVEWVVSGGPAIAPGMGNTVKRKGLVDLYFDYLDGWTISGEEVTLSLSGKWKTPKQQEDAEKSFLAKNPGWRISPKKEVSVDYLVYAQGPDTAKIWNIFDETATQDLQLNYDKYARFGAQRQSDEADAVSLKYSDRNIDDDVRNWVKSVLGKDHPQIFGTTITLMGRAKGILKLPTMTFEPIALQEDVAIGLGSESGSLQIIGGSAIRILNYLDSTINQRKNIPKEIQEIQNRPAQTEKDLKKVKELQDKLEEIKPIKVPKELTSGKTSAEMTKVMTTLSAPTLLMNDQLTPIRSQMEAQGNFMPGYIGTNESNLVTDDQQMIAAQIGSYYANIPPALANWVTQKIIQDRHETGVKPGTEQGSRAFVDRWKDTLEQLQNLFSRQNIRQIAEAIAKKA